MITSVLGGLGIRYCLFCAYSLGNHVLIFPSPCPSDPFPWVAVFFGCIFRCPTPLTPHLALQCISGSTVLTARLSNVYFALPGCLAFWFPALVWSDRSTDGLGFSVVPSWANVYFIPYSRCRPTRFVALAARLLGMFPVALLTICGLGRLYHISPAPSSLRKTATALGIFRFLILQRRGRLKHGNNRIY